MAQLSVVISTLGNYSGLSRVLDRLEAQDAEPGSFEVVVVADAADPEPDAVDGAIGSRGYPVRHLTGSRPGLSANRNAGWRAARSPLVLFTDNDTLAEPQLISEHLSWHARHPEDEVAILGHVRWAREIEVTPFMHWLDHGMQFDYPNIEGIEAGWGRFYGANVSAKRSFVERVGGFDEERLPYLYDDLDFGYRANQHGLRLLYDRRAVVEHLREMDLAYWRDRMAQVAHAEREFVRLHPDVTPYFHAMFSAAAAQPRARGRGRHLIRLIPRSLPWLGPRVWRSADRYYRQALAPPFLAAWEKDEPEPSQGPVAPYLLSRDAVSSGGSSPEGSQRPR
jgi:GT2 family glycosyltransferase